MNIFILCLLLFFVNIIFLFIGFVIGYKTAEQTIYQERQDIYYKEESDSF